MSEYNHSLTFFVNHQEFILEFIDLSDFFSDIPFGIPVIQVELSAVNIPNVEFVIVLKLMIYHIRQYIMERNVVLMYVCDTSEIHRSKRNLYKTPQQYRSELFEAMYQYSKPGQFIKFDTVYSQGDDPGNFQYFSLIAQKENEHFLDDIRLIAHDYFQK